MERVRKGLGNIRSLDSGFQESNKPLEPAVTAPDGLLGLQLYIFISSSAGK